MHPLFHLHTNIEYHVIIEDTTILHPVEKYRAQTIMMKYLFFFFLPTQSRPDQLTETFLTLTAQNSFATSYFNFSFSEIASPNYPS